MADPVAGATIPHAKLPARAVEKQMVVRISEIRLNQIVVNILCE
jgi:C4-dicarboxylate-specific signal transduction histidine kinase